MKALILVDIQNDFLPGGRLAVPRGDEVIAVANRIMPCFEVVVATQDWHGPQHGSFASSHPGDAVGDRIELNGLDQILWPDHCVRRTPGADFAPGLHRFGIDRVFRKGTNDAVDSYSGFFDNARRFSTGLGEYLRHRGVREVYVCGLATDYCVKATAIDAAGLGFETFLVEDGCRGVELNPGDVERALEEMKRAGVRIVRSGAIAEAVKGCVA
jgi:nicotinamidase/pyrazinamidase